MGSFFILSSLVLFNPLVSGLTTYECRDMTGSVIPIEIPSPGHPIAITSPDYPDTFNLTRLNCKWSIKALHGAQLKVQLVDSDLNDGCFDNILEVVDDTPATGKSKLKYPGKSAKCGQNDFVSIDEVYETAAKTLSVSFKSLKNNGHATFKLKVSASMTGVCPAQKPSGCPNGPCCKGIDCCVINTGNEAEEISVPDGGRPGLDCQYKLVAAEGAQVSVNFLEMDIHADVNEACLTDYVMIQDPVSSASSLIGEDGLTFCGQRLPNYPGPSVIVSGGNSLVLKYHTDESSAKKGSGFKAKVSAINPICNPMEFEQVYGGHVCNSTCGITYTPTTTTKTPTGRTPPTRKPRQADKQTTTPPSIEETCEEYDTDFYGNDIECKKNSATKWEECAQICNGNDRCTHWSWLSDDDSIKESWQHTCCLKASDAGRWKKKGIVSGKKNCGTCEEMDTDYLGNDIDAILDVPTWEQCSHVCKLRSDCSHWTWVSDDYTDNPSIIHKCHLKNSDSGREDASGLISGTSDCGKFAEAQTTTKFQPSTPPTLTNETCQDTGIKLISEEYITNIDDVSTWEQCANLCASIGECTHWNWYKDDKQCSVLTSVVDKEEEAGIISGTEKCGEAMATTKTTPTIVRPTRTPKTAEKKTPTPPPSITETCEEKDIDYYGNDIDCRKNSAVKWEDCAKMCKGNSRCTHWTWLSEDSSIVESWQHACCLKTSDKGRWKKNGMVSGPKECGTCEEMDTDYLGNDIGAVLDVETWEQCSHICNQRSDCSHWTWVNDDYTINPDIIHKCHLKNSDSGREEVGGLISGSSECGEWSPPRTTATVPPIDETCASKNTRLLTDADESLLEDVPTWEQCANLCASVSSCSHWNWNTAEKCSLLTSVVDEETAMGYKSGTAECGEALPTTTSKTTITPETTMTPTTSPLTEILTTEGRKCDILEMKIQVIDADTAEPLPRAKVTVKSLDRGSGLKGVHFADANGEITEIGTLQGTYNFRITLKKGLDLWEGSITEQFENATCTNEACTECRLHEKLQASKLPRDEVVNNCTCKGEVKLINELTKLPIVGACVSYKVKASDTTSPPADDKTIEVEVDKILTDTSTEASTDDQTAAATDSTTDDEEDSSEDDSSEDDSLSDRIYKMLPLSRSLFPKLSNRDDIDCKDNWCKYEPTNALFKYFETTTTWKDAQETCISFGARLASIPSTNVNTFISEKLPKPEDGGYWIGGNKVNGIWTWGDKSPWNYANWAEGEPNGNNENCAELHEDGSFNDVNCEVQRRFICKKKDVPAPPSCQLRTDVDGMIDIDTDQIGFYEFTITHEEYDNHVFTTKHVGASDDDSCEECNIAVTYELRKPFCNMTDNPVNLKIKVTNFETKDPVEGAEVTTYINEGTDTSLTQTDENGITYVTITQNGDYTVQATGNNLEPISLTENIYCDPKECKECNPVVELFMSPPPADSTIPPPDCDPPKDIENSLTVKTFDKSDGKPLPTAEISILYNKKYIANNVGLTNSTYKTEITENGVYIINGTAEGYDPKSINITTNCGSCQEPDIDLLGNDLKYITNVQSWNDCAELCKDEEGCTHWTWASGDYTIDTGIVFYCFLKDSDAGRTMTEGLISGGEDCDKTKCHNCINIVKLYISPECHGEETDFTVKVFEAVTRTPIEGATVKITDVSDDSPRLISNHLVCPKSDIEPCGWNGITEEECGQMGCCHKPQIAKIANSTLACFKKVERIPMETNFKGIVIAPSPGKAKIHVEVEKEGYETLNGTVDVFCKYPCESCTPSFTAIIKKKELCEDKDINMKINVVDKEGNPIDEATVTKKLIKSAAGATTTDSSEVLKTDSTGSVTSPIYESGTYMISVTAKGYNSKSDEVTVDDDSCKEEIPVDLTLKPQKSEDHCEESDITISVFDETTEKGIPGVKVTVKLSEDDEVIASVQTGPSGTVKIPVSENGEYSVKVEKKDFKEEVHTTEIQYPKVCKTELEIPVKQEKCKETIMPVVILNNATLEPIPNALVRVVLTNSTAGTSITTLDKPKYTNENGTAFFNTPMNGDYTVGVTVDGFDPIEVTKNVMCDTKNCAGCAPVVTIHTPPTYCPDKSIKLIVLDCETNDPVADVSVVTTIDSVTRGQVDGGTVVTSENGQISIPVTENGIYDSVISLDGYVTTRNSFEVAITMDDCDTFNPVDTIPLCPPPEPSCTEVSLSWTNSVDIDLEAFRMNMDNRNDTCSTKPACCTGRCKKEECPGVTPTIDGEGQPGVDTTYGSETIKYCNTDEYSNMIYVSDPTDVENNLPNSGARLVIANGEKEQIVRIETTEQSENSKFWLAGCLVTEDSSFKFISINKFTENKPELEDRNLCYDMVNIERKTKEDVTLENSKILVNIFDAETGEPISGAIAEASIVTESISRVSDEAGQASIKVTKNGEYVIGASAKGYVASESSTTLDCAENADEDCVNTVTFSLLPTGKTDKVEIVLNWGSKSTDLDLHTMQINKESPGAGCETYFNKLSGCENTNLEENKINGGSDGGEKVTISNLENNLKWTYMIFVKDNSPDTDELEISEAHIDISDGSKSLAKSLPKFTSDTPSGANFWFVGCLRIVGETFEFAAVDTLSRESPYITQKLFCDNLFKKNPQAGQVKPSDFCDGVSMNVKLQTDQESAFSSLFVGCGASCTNVQIISVGNDQQKIIFDDSPQGDIVSVPITSNGQYLVKLEGDDYVSTEMAFNVLCDITKCQTCRPSFVLPVSPKLEDDQARIMLSWARFPLELQVFSFERGCEEKDIDYYGDDIRAELDVPSWEICSYKCASIEGCTHWTWVDNTYTKFPQIIRKCHLKNGNSGRVKGAGLVSGKAGCKGSGSNVKKSSTTASISLTEVSSSMAGKVGMIFVENLSKVPKFAEDSHVRVTITDGTTISKNQMDLANYGGENFWIAGCYKVDNGIINFSPEASFINSRPDLEVPDYCLKFYGL